MPHCAVVRNFNKGSDWLHLKLWFVTMASWTTLQYVIWLVFFLAKSIVRACKRKKKVENYVAIFTFLAIFGRICYVCDTKYLEHILLITICPESSATGMGQFSICKLKRDFLRTPVTACIIHKKMFSAPFGIFYMRMEI